MNRSIKKIPGRKFNTFNQVSSVMNCFDMMDYVLEYEVKNGIYESNHEGYNSEKGMIIIHGIKFSTLEVYRVPGKKNVAGIKPLYSNFK